jgi:sugar porter (SP) family MFS transporter
MSTSTTSLVSKENTASSSYGTINQQTVDSAELVVDDAFSPFKENEQKSLLPDKPKPGITPLLLCACFTMVLSFFHVGFASGAVNSPELIFRNCDTESKEYKDAGFFKPCVKADATTWALAVSIFTIGGMVGGFLGGVADVIGRRNTLILTNIPVLIANAGIACFSNIWIVIAMRFLMGFGVGIASTVQPIYLAEVAPDHLRGSLGTFTGIALASGILVAQIFGIFLSKPILWRAIFVIGTIPCFFQMIVLPFFPKSPRFLIAKNKFEEAEKSLQKYRGTSDVTEEVNLLRVSLSVDSTSTKKGFTVLFEKQSLYALFLGCSLQVMQQLSGVNLVYYYSTGLFVDAGLGDWASIASAGVCAFNVICVVISTFITDKAGRKTLFILSLTLQFIFFTGLSVCLIAQSYGGEKVKFLLGVCGAICVIGFIGGYSVGNMSIPFIMLAELFPSDIRANAASIATAVNWLSTFFVGMSFPLLRSYIQAYSFVPFVVIILASIVFTAIFIPETKGKRLD